MDLNQQKNLTGGKGWKNVLVDYGKGKKEQITTKVKNIVGWHKSNSCNSLRKLLKKKD